MNSNLWILAQASANEPLPGIVSTPVNPQETSTTLVVSDSNAARPVTSQPRPLGPSLWLYVGLMVILMYMILFRGPQKQKRQHKQMVSSLQKNDKVQTIGGVIGIIVDIKDDEITLKVDESNNTKIKVVPSAIGKNLSKEKKEK
jgi:preprotein translocase subunit YajC